MPLTDDDLISAMFGQDRDLARIAVREFTKRHPEQVPDMVAEPPHCDECFEGCPKCQPSQTLPPA